MIWCLCNTLGGWLILSPSESLYYLHVGPDQELLANPADKGMPGEDCLSYSLWSLPICDHAFGLHGAVTTFQPLMNQLLSSSYIVMAGRTTYIMSLWLFKHSKARLIVNFSKCWLGQVEITYLRYSIWWGWLYPVVDKVQTLIWYLAPSTNRQ